MKVNQIHFFIVGSARCGTTFLYNCLSSNSNIFLPKVKEPNFFSNVESLIDEEYEDPLKDIEYHSKVIKSQSVYNSLYEDAKSNQIKGDVSPSYLWDLTTAQRLFDHNPNARILITLRNPIDMAYSHYKMNYYIGMEEDSFPKSLKADSRLEWGGSNKYLEMGLYYHQVKKYFEVFPKDQIKVIIYEDWTKNVELSINDITDFLGVKKENLDFKEMNFGTNEIRSLKHLKILNRLRRSGLKKRIKKVIPQGTINTFKEKIFGSNTRFPELDTNTRETLREYFKEDVNQLSNLLEQKLTEKWT